MRTIIAGPVTAEDLENADLLAGITPTSFVTNGLSQPPTALPTAVYEIDPKLGRCGSDARDYTLCLNADALVVAGYDHDHLTTVARRYGLPVMEVAW